MKFYLQLITPMIPAGTDPRHVMAYILTGRNGGGLSNMSKEQFQAEATLCTACVKAVGPASAERSAQSWGL